jgi:2-C-methyl-D-erythritol 4-phosphate cytidylyltransferase
LIFLRFSIEIVIYIIFTAMKYAIIVAGGNGTRMQSQIPKQFLDLNDKPVICYSIESFLSVFPDIQIVVVLPKDYIEHGKSVLSYLKSTHPIIYVEGGQSRFHSVKNGLMSIPNNGVVFIHDAVRPCISRELLQLLFVKAESNGNAIPCIDLKDSLRKVELEKNRAVDRSKYKIIQTPQVFQAELIKQAFEQDFNEQFTDEATVLEGLGQEISLIEGDEANIKITKPIDLTLMSLLLRK